MKIIVDSREQAPFSFQGYECEVIEGGLATGDYSLVGLETMVAVERKSLDDLVGCLTGAGRDRFERELARARGFDCFAVVIEAAFSDLGAKKYKSGMNAHAACQSVLAFQIRYSIPFVWAGDRRAAEYTVYWTLSKYLREAETRLKSIVRAHGETQDLAHPALGAQEQSAAPAN